MCWGLCSRWSLLHTQGCCGGGSDCRCHTSCTAQQRTWAAAQQCVSKCEGGCRGTRQGNTVDWTGRRGWEGTPAATAHSIPEILPSCTSQCCSMPLLRGLGLSLSARTLHELLMQVAAAGYTACYMQARPHTSTHLQNRCFAVLVSNCKHHSRQTVSQADMNLLCLKAHPADLHMPGPVLLLQLPALLFVQHLLSCTASDLRTGMTPLQPTKSCRHTCTVPGSSPGCLLLTAA